MSILIDKSKKGDYSSFMITGFPQTGTVFMRPVNRYTNRIYAESLLQFFQTTMEL